MASFNVQLAFPFPTPPLDLAPVQLCNGCCSGTKIFLDKGIQNSRTLTARKLALKEHLEPFQTYKIAFILVTHCKGSHCRRTPLNVSLTKGPILPQARAVQDSILDFVPQTFQLKQKPEPTTKPNLEESTFFYFSCF